MVFDPSKYGATPAQTSTFDPSKYGASLATPTKPGILSDTWNSIVGSVKDLGHSVADATTFDGQGNPFAYGAEHAADVSGKALGVVASPLAPAINKAGNAALDYTEKRPALQAPIDLASHAWDSLTGAFKTFKEKNPVTGNLAETAFNLGQLYLAGKGTFKATDLSPIDTLKGYADTKVKASITSDVDGLLNSTKSLAQKTEEAARRGTNYNEILSDPQVFKGIKVDNLKINPDEAIATIDDRIQKLLDVKQKMLPKIDTLTPSIPKAALRARAIESITGKYTPADEVSLIDRIDKQIAALPDQLSPSQVDKLRAQFRQSARDAKGQMKSDSEYAALETAARDTIFDVTDNLPINGSAQYKALNDYIKQMIQTKTFLDKSIRGQTVKGGRVGIYTTKVIGAIAGSSHGPLGTLAGSEIGGLVADVIANNKLGSSMKISIISNLTEDPAILAQAHKLLGDISELNTPLLPPGSNDLRLNQNRPVIAGQTGEYVGPDVRIGDYRNINQAANKQITNTTNIPEAIPQDAIKAINNHLTTAEQVIKELPPKELEAHGGIPFLIERTRTNIADGLEAQGAKGLADQIRAIDLSAFQSWDAFKQAVLDYVKNIQPGLSMKNVSFDKYYTRRINEKELQYLLDEGVLPPNADGKINIIKPGQEGKVRGVTPDRTYRVLLNHRITDILDSKKTNDIFKEGINAQDSVEGYLDSKYIARVESTDGSRAFKLNKDGQFQEYDPKTGQWLTTASKQSKDAGISTGSAPTGKEGVSAQRADTSGPFEGTKLYHGTSVEGDFTLSNDQPTYLTPDQKIANGFANDVMYGSQQGGIGRVVDITQARVGKIKTIEIPKDIGYGIKDHVAAEVAKAKAEGYRYVDFTHPAIEIDQADFPVRVSLYPADDLKLSPSPSIPKGLEPLAAEARKFTTEGEWFDWVQGRAPATLKKLGFIQKNGWWDVPGYDNVYDFYNKVIGKK